MAFKSDEHVLLDRRDYEHEQLDDVDDEHLVHDLDHVDEQHDHNVDRPRTVRRIMVRRMVRTPCPADLIRARARCRITVA